MGEREKQKKRSAFSERGGGGKKKRSKFGRREKDGPGARAGAHGLALRVPQDVVDGSWNPAAGRSGRRPFEYRPLSSAGEEELQDRCGGGGEGFLLAGRCRRGFLRCSWAGKTKHVCAFSFLGFWLVEDGWHLCFNWLNMVHDSGNSIMMDFFLLFLINPLVLFRPKVLTNSGILSS